MTDERHDPAPATAQWVPEEAAAVRFAPTETPDRVILTWRGDPATTQAVTWRTDTSVNGAVAEIAVEDAHPEINTDTVRVEAATTPVGSGGDRRRAKPFGRGHRPAAEHPVRVPGG